VLVLLVLITSLVTCCCWLARGRWTDDKESSEDKEYWAPEESEHSVTTSSFTGEILREEEMVIITDMAQLQQRKSVAASPSIFSQEDFLQENLEVSCLSVTRYKSNCIDLEVMHHVLEDEFEDEYSGAQLSLFKKPMSASTIALSSLDMDSPALAMYDSENVIQADECEAYGKAGKKGNDGGWLLYSIMREITSSPRNCDSMVDDVFNSRQDSSMENYSIPVKSCRRREPSKDGSSLGESGFVARCSDDYLATEQNYPLEVKVIIETDSQSVN